MKKLLIFKISAIFYGATAIYHLLAIIGLFDLRGASLERHAVFVFLTTLMAYGLWFSPNKIFTWFFGIMTLQQLYSHGGDMIRVWNESQAIDWMSMPSVLGFPILLSLMVLKLREKSVLLPPRK